MLCKRQAMVQEDEEEDEEETFPRRILAVKSAKHKTNAKHDDSDLRGDATPTCEGTPVRSERPVPWVTRTKGLGCQCLCCVASCGPPRS